MLGLALGLDTRLFFVLIYCLFSIAVVLFAFFELTLPSPVTFFGR
jgi:hypothetical protein